MDRRHIAVRLWPSGRLGPASPRRDVAGSVDDPEGGRLVTTETVLITGASSGIGRELAHCFAGDGATLILLARRIGELEALASELRARHGIDVHVLECDLADPTAPEATERWLKDRRLVVDVLVNNAGFGAKVAFADHEHHDQLQMVQVNAVALIDLTRRFLPPMLERGRGGVLNVGSMAGFAPGPGMATYYATKAFVNSLTEALAEETRGSAVQITLLAPGPVHTEFGARAGFGKNSSFDLRATAAPQVARAAHRGFRRGQVLVIPDLGNRAGLLALRLAPRSLVRRIIHAVQSH